MKLDIENKIVIPFVIILLLTIGVLGIVSYWNGYQNLSQNEKQNIEDYLDGAVFFIQTIDELVKQGTVSELEGKKIAIDYITAQSKANMLVIENNNIIIDTSNNKNFYEENIAKEKSNGHRIVNNKSWMFIYKNFDGWNWTLGFVVKKNILSEELLAIQKNILLIAIIALVFSMQSTIFVAHNISKPIKILADACNKIAKGNLKEEITINRQDEIGILASAFSNMIEKLRLNTKKIVEMQKFNEDILRNVPAGIITTDKEGSIISVNKAGQDILGYNLLEEESRLELSESIFEQIKNTLKIEKNINNVYSFNNENGNEKKYLDITTSLLKTEESLITGAICNINDITRRKKIENRIDRVDRLTSLGQLAAGLAHEIRNPLAGMKMSIQVLKNRLCKEGGESNLKLFNATLYEIDRLNGLIVELLDFAKPHTPKYEVTNIIDILDKSLYLMKKATNEKKIRISLKGNEKPKYIFVDKAQIEQVLLNILSNAINAMDVQGRLDIDINTITNDKGKYVIIQVQDNGCGIRKEDLEKIFDPFYTTNSYGTGLGLSVVHKLVTENNGEIDIDSIIHVGTRFRIKFTLYSGDKDEEENINS